MGNVIAFVGVVGLIVVVPGPDMALVLRNGVGKGRRAAVETALGINAGLLVWALAAALGVAALVRASEPAFTALRVAGGAYLVWLGLRALAAAWRGGAEHVDAGPARWHLSPFAQRLLSNLLNPKIALVFTTLVPQFVDPAGPAVPQTLLLAGIFIGMGAAWLVTYALVVARVGAVLARSGVRRALNAVTGAVLGALGLRVALGSP